MSNPLKKFVPESLPNRTFDKTSKKKAPKAEERVYFMREEYEDGTLGRIKIGISNSPGYRRRKLQTGNSDRIIILGSIPGGKPEEDRLHRLLAPWRKQGEWFYPADEVIGLVDRVIRAGSLDDVEQSFYDKRFDVFSHLIKPFNNPGEPASDDRVNDDRANDDRANDEQKAPQTSKDQ